MASADTVASKQLRWKLLELFPQVPMKLLVQAAKSRDIHEAMDMVAAGSVVASGEPPRSDAALPAPPERSNEAEGEKTLRTEAAVALAECPPDEALPEPSELSKVVEQGEISCTEPTAALTAHSPASERASAEPEDTAAEALDVMQADVRTTWTEDKHSSLEGRKIDIPSNVRKSNDGWEIRFEVDLLRPCQSLRTKNVPGGSVVKTVLDRCGTDNTAAFASICFEQMLRREQELEGKFCVFYHSYNSAALIYEIQSEIARYAFGMGDNFAPLPRIIQKHFEGETIDSLRNSEGAQHHDNLPSFRKLAICASPTIFAFGSEAPPLDCFRHGYGIPAPLRQLTQDLLQNATGKNVSHKFMEQLSRLAKRFGLVAYENTAGAPPGPNRLGGQMLQIFIHRSDVNGLVYNSLPFGVPIPTGSIRRWLAGEDRSHEVDGQVRILMRPEVFLDSARARIFHYAGDWEFHGGSPDMEGSRAAFVSELRKIMQPTLSEVSPTEMRRRLTVEKDRQNTTRTNCQGGYVRCATQSAGKYAKSNRKKK